MFHQDSSEAALLRETYAQPKPMSNIYRKTAKGVAEIETRAHRLTPRMRSALILVDGRRSEDELRALVQYQADETIDGLVVQGFIEVAAVAAPRPAPAVPPAPVAAAVAPPRPAAPTIDIKTLCRDAVRELSHQVGPMAEALAIKMERAKTYDELRPLLDSAAQVIDNTRGSTASGAFRSRFLGG
ncbi:MAG TPA: hypothetical protein VIW70_16120 [Rubrivivax sp.]